MYVHDKDNVTYSLSIHIVYLMAKNRVEKNQKCCLERHKGLLTVVVVVGAVVVELVVDGVVVVVNGVVVWSGEVVVGVDGVVLGEVGTSTHIIYFISDHCIGSNRLVLFFLSKKLKLSFSGIIKCKSKIRINKNE